MFWAWINRRVGRRELCLSPVWSATLGILASTGCQKKKI